MGTGSGFAGRPHIMSGRDRQDIITQQDCALQCRAVSICYL
jgi:hypothetical protein